MFSYTDIETLKDWSLEEASPIQYTSLFGVCRWEKYQSEEEAALGRGKRQRKAVSYREAYAAHLSEALSEVLVCFCLGFF